MPRNDDWAYRRLALDLAATGRLALNVKTMVIGQVLITQPLLWLSHLQPWAFAVAGVLFAGCAAVSGYALARQFLPPAKAAAAAALLLVFPGYLAYATSFMTDAPTLAAQFSCLALGAIALKARPLRDRWLVASIVVGCIGFSLRDFAVAAPAAVLVAAICVEPRRARLWALAFTVAGAYALLYLLRVALYPKDEPVLPDGGGMFQSVQAVAIVSLVVMAAAVIGGVRWRARLDRRDVAIGAELGILLVAARLIVWLQQGILPTTILPNLASQWGTPQRQIYLGDRPLLFGDAAWIGISLLALVATVVTLGVSSGIAGAYIRASGRSLVGLRRLFGSPGGILTLFLAATVGGLMVYGQVNRLFDRYYWSVIPPLATVLMYLPPRLDPNPRTASGGAKRLAMMVATPLVAVLGIVSMVFALNSNAFDAGLWRAGEELAASGVKPNEIDAGYSWLGLHASTPTGAGGTGPGFEMLWPAFHRCGFVTSDNHPLPGTQLVGTASYPLYLVTGPAEQLYLFRETDVSCR